jgi:hypothetical protein
LPNTFRSNIQAAHSPCGYIARSKSPLRLAVLKRILGTHLFVIALVIDHAGFS